MTTLYHAPLHTGSPISPYFYSTSRPTAPAMRDDLCRLLMDGSQMAYFDFDPQSGALMLSVLNADGRREMRCYQPFLPMLRAQKSIPMDIRQSMITAIHQACEKPGRNSVSLCLDLHACGEYRWYLAYVESFAGSDGTVQRIIGSLRDVQYERQTELRLQSMRIYRRAVDCVSLFMFEFDLPDFQPRSTGKHHPKGYYALSQYLTPAVPALVHPKDAGTFFGMLSEAALLDAYRHQRFELTQSARIRNICGQWIWVRLTVHLSAGNSGIEARGIGYIQVIQDHKVLEERARKDCVTGLYNRATIEELVDSTLMKEPNLSYFFIFDIDNFKAVNDTQGHAEGDRLLCLITDALRRSMRKSDLLGRIGGDEFVALLCDLPDKEAAVRRAEAMLKAVQQIKRPSSWKSAPTLSVSIGIAQASPSGASFSILYRSADKALYEAKSEGKNRYRFYEE